MLDVFVLGIDVSKDTLSCTLLQADTRRPRWHKEVKNTAAGWKQLLGHTPQAAPWVLEPTGRYSQDVARAAREAGTGRAFGAASQSAVVSQKRAKPRQDRQT